MTTACPKCSACGCDATAETCLLRELRAQLTHEREARAMAEAECEHMRVMLGAIKAWCSRRSDAEYAERLAISGLSAPPPAKEPK